MGDRGENERPRRFVPGVDSADDVVAALEKKQQASMGGGGKTDESTKIERLLPYKADEIDPNTVDEAGRKITHRERIRAGEEKSDYQRRRERREARLAEFMKFVEAKVEAKKKLLKEEMAWLRRGREESAEAGEEFYGEKKLKKDKEDLQKWEAGSTPKITEGMAEHEDIEGLEAFRKMADAAIDFLVTHGTVVREGDKWVLKNFSDSDGNMCMYLCKLAGLKTAKIVHVNKGEAMDGALVADTSGREGVSFDALTDTLYIDHHGDSSPSDSSASEYVYDVFFGAGLIEPTMELEGAVEFIRAADNGFFLEGNPIYQGFHEEFLNIHRTMAGLSRFLSAEEIVSFFKIVHGKFRDPFEPLTDDDFAEWKRGSGKSLRERSEEMKMDINDSIRQIAELVSEGFVLESKGHGKILVDIGKRVKMGSQAAFAIGADVYVAWNPGKKSFVIQSRERTLDISLKEGIGVRDRMLLKPMDDGKELEMSLGDLLRVLMGEDFVAEGGVAEYLEVEAEGEGEQRPDTEGSTRNYLDELMAWGLQIKGDQPEKGEVVEGESENEEDDVYRIMQELRRAVRNDPTLDLKEEISVRREKLPKKRKWWKTLLGREG